VPLRAQSFHPDIPKVWDDGEMARFELPLAHAAASPKHVPAEYNYRIPVRTIYKSYPPVAPGQDFEEYLRRLEQAEPEIAFDASKLRTRQDWVRAGKAVFEAPTSFINDGVRSSPSHAFLARYVVRRKGHVDQGNLACANFHVRQMTDGTVIPGAQEYFSAPQRALAVPASTPAQLRATVAWMFAAPWLQPDPNTSFSSDQELVGFNRFFPGVRARMGASLRWPVQIPDLISVKDRKYLDHTGMVQQRSIVDLMRYAATNQGDGYMQALSHYGDFLPRGALPDPASLERFSDEQLYALALYVYSLEPPPNPNRFDELAARGQKVFEREGCAGCHPPPHYTNNKITPAESFQVPVAHRQKYDILPVVVGTDPFLAMQTRRGTGYYKVPPLKGVWYRGPLEHNGSVATLEDWFDPRRLRDDYVPTGFKPYGMAGRAVKGHEFGLRLSNVEKEALLAFLRSL
jgi:hypothetical protein